MTKISRRSLLAASAAGGLATAIPTVQFANAAQAAPASAPAAGGRVQNYVELGKTGLKISDVSFGSSRLREGEERLVHHALERGVNYIDTAESYGRSVSETVIGRALKGIRNEVYLATKMHVSADTRASEMMSSLDASLKRLQTDHVEIFLNHAVNDIDRLQNPEWPEFVDRARQQGKFQFTGMSGHAGQLVETLDYAIEQDMFDMVLVAHNFGQDPAFYERFIKRFDFVAPQPDLPRALRAAKKKNWGVIAMKVLRGAKLNDMRPFESGGATYAQAAFRWTLSTDFVDAAIISMTSAEQIDEYLGGSGGLAAGEEDMALLTQYARLTDLSYCRHACNDCAGACPYQVQIADVLRTRMYATDYGDLPFAKAEYAGIENSAAACLSCDGQPCHDACTHGLSIAKLCGPTHEMLA